MPDRMQVVHTFAPVFDENSRVLLLGTMPSPRSRENGFYYSHPQNRFWPVMAALFHEPLPHTPEEKEALVRRHGIALWDVLHSCEIRGAEDASIRQACPNDLAWLLAQCPIRAIFATGQKAAALYRRYCEPETGRPILTLPSTSPANCRVSRDELIDAYRMVLPYLKEEENP